jgi:hypothetical protein
MPGAAPCQSDIRSQPIVTSGLVTARPTGFNRADAINIRRPIEGVGAYRHLASEMA